NPNYQSQPPVRTISTNFMKRFAIAQPEPMYLTGVKNPACLEFLNHPEKYAIELSAITS
ncbi:MAG: hypothetical protein HY545_02430, partial [Candidatus Doudnabacteria bacterium]|nr:hypothetical protein [Candidatus Doudnabacteria bacterium]